MEYLLDQGQGGKRLASVSADDDIVHPIKKLVDKCNQLVVGSNPTPGANKNNANFGVIFCDRYFKSECVVRNKQR